MKKPKISAIVPIFNIEKHLPRCLDSIISQTLPDIEIICVNDYSSDNCQAILDDYAKKDSRIIVIQHSENKSILQARKSGVQIAKGEFIIFVDGDDALEPDAMDTLYESMTKTNVDICHFPTRVIGISTKTDLTGIIEFVKPHYDVLRDDNVFDGCFVQSAYNWSIWNKIYKAGLCKKSYQSASNMYCNMAEDVYSYFIISYFGKSYLGIGGDTLYNYYYGLGMTGGDTNKGLRKLSTICEQSRIAPELRKFLNQQNAPSRYYDVVDGLEKRFMAECVWYWYNILPDSDCAEGFDILLAHWESEKIIAFLAKTHFDKQEIIAQKILGSSSLKVKKEKITNIGVFYHRMRNGGVERVISLLIPVWIDLGFNVVFFTDEEPTDNDFSLPDCIERVVLPTSIGISPENTPLRITALREGILNHDIDVFIHNAGTSPMLIYDLLVVKTMGIPAIVSSHECFSSSLFWRDKGVFKKVHVYKIADLVIVLTNADLKFWTLFGIKTMYIPNPLFSDINNIIQSKLETQNVIWVGRFAIEKQYIHPVQIFAQVVREIPDAKLLMVGQGESSATTDELRNEIERLGLAQNVVLCGYFKDITHFYQMSSVYLTTSYHESFSMALIESRAFGIPTVAYELPNLDILHDDNKGVVLTSQRDILAAAGAIVKLLGDQEYRIKMGMDARRSTEIFYQNNNVGDQWNKVLSKSIFSKKHSVAGEQNDEEIYRRMFQSILLHYEMGLTASLEIAQTPITQSSPASAVTTNIIDSQSWQIPAEVLRGLENLQKENLIIRKSIERLNFEKVKSTVSFLWIIIYPLRKLYKAFRNNYFVIQKNIRLLKTSGMFDQAYYLKNNPDVIEAGVNPIKHFLVHGGREGRFPSEKFDPAFYLEQNPDVKASGMNPLVHYIRFGQSEGREV